MSSKSDQAEASQAHVLSQGRTRGWDCWAFVPVPLESVVQVSKIILSCLINCCNSILAVLPVLVTNVYSLFFIVIFAD
jgi:hypothetical protein